MKSSHTIKKGLIVDTDIGGDVDDEVMLLTLKLLNEPSSEFKLLAISTVHIEPEIKAKMVSLITKESGHPNIPVHVGIGSRRADTKESFVQQCPLFPPFFGYPPAREVRVQGPMTVADLAKQMLVRDIDVLNEMKDLKITVEETSIPTEQTIISKEIATTLVKEMGFTLKAETIGDKKSYATINSDKMWYPKFSKAYRDKFGAELDEMKIESEPAPDMIVRLARKHSLENKLTIVAIGPLHNIDAALQMAPDIADKIKLVTMGGLYPLGYNWLISPQVTKRVLEQVETVVISSQFINQNKMAISKQELADISANIKTPLGEAFIKSCQNWYKGDFFKKDGVFSYDPLTFYLAVNHQEVSAYEEKEISFPCLDDKNNLRPEYIGKWYNQKDLDDKIIKVHSSSVVDIESKAEKSKESGLIKVRFVSQVKSPELLREHILAMIKNILLRPAPTIESQPTPKSPTKHSYKGYVFGAAAVLGVGLFARHIVPAIATVATSLNTAFKR